MHEGLEGGGEHARGEHLEHRAVALLEDRGVFHADGSQIVDIEKPTVIDLVAGLLPMG